MYRLFLHAESRGTEEKYGVDPEVTYFESPVVVDNLTAEIITA